MKKTFLLSCLMLAAMPVMAACLPLFYIDSYRNYTCTMGRPTADMICRRSFPKKPKLTVDNTATPFAVVAAQPAVTPQPVEVVRPFKIVVSRGGMSLKRVHQPTTAVVDDNGPKLKWRFAGREEMED